MSRANSARNRKSASQAVPVGKPLPAFAVPDRELRILAIGSAITYMDNVDLMRALFGAIEGLAEFSVSFRQIQELAKRGRMVANELHNDIDLFGESFAEDKAREGKNWQDFTDEEVAHG